MRTKTDSSHDYVISPDGILQKYNGFEENIVIPHPIAAIGEHAFAECISLVSVQIPYGVTYIGEHAFSGCRRLRHVTIPDSVHTIGKMAFFQCSSLQEIHLPRHLSALHDSVFAYCTALERIDIPDSVTAMGDLVFYGCSRLSEAHLPSQLTTIEGAVFQGCTSLKTITLPDTLQEITASAFADCTSLTQIRIPASVISIGSQAFRNCAKLQSITIPQHVSYIGLGAFADCSSLQNIQVSEQCDVYTSLDGVLYFKDLHTLHTYPAGRPGYYVIPDGVSAIFEMAFAGSTHLCGVTIPDSVTRTGDYAFTRCPLLVSAGPMESTCNIRFAWKDAIPAYVFGHCHSLQSITIPSTITQIGEKAFTYCTHLSDVHCPPHLIHADHFAYTPFWKKQKKDRR